MEARSALVSAEQTVRGEVTRALRDLASGDGEAKNRLWPIVYDELRAIAARQGRHGAHASTLQPTEVVHEAYLRLVDQSRTRWKDRQQFFAISARIMRRVLIDWARRQKRLKRGGGFGRVRLDGHDDGVPGPEGLQALVDAIECLGELHERCGRVVEMRLFAGLGFAEIAASLQVSKRTVEGDWQFARSWLSRTLSPNA